MKLLRRDSESDEKEPTSLIWIGTEISNERSEVIRDDIVVNDCVESVFLSCDGSNRKESLFACGSR